MHSPDNGSNATNDLGSLARIGAEDRQMTYLDGAVRGFWTFAYSLADFWWQDLAGRPRE